MCQLLQTVRKTIRLLLSAKFFIILVIMNFKADSPKIGIRDCQYAQEI